MSEVDLKFLKEHRWKLFLILSVLFFAYAFVEFVVPTASSVIYVWNKTKEYHRKISQVHKEDTTDYYQLKKKKKKLQKEIQEFVFNQNQQTHLSNILSFLSQSARKEGVRILSIKPQSAAKVKKHIELPIEVDVTTKFHRLGRFLNNIETSDSIIRVKSIDITAKNITSNILYTKIILVVYYLGKEDE